MAETGLKLPAVDSRLLKRSGEIEKGSSLYRESTTK